MPTTKLHIKARTQLVKGLYDRRRDRGRVSALVQNLAETPGIRGDAIDAAVAAWEAISATRMHHEISDLPLLEAAAQSFLGVTPGRCYVDLRFGRDATTNPTMPSFAMATVSPHASRSIDVPYNRTGYGAGDEAEITASGIYYFRAFGGSNSLGVFMKEREAPVSLITVDAGRLTTDPSDAVADLFGHVNSDAVSIGSRFDCAPKTLMFAGHRVQPIDQDGVRRYSTTYYLHWSPLGWGRWRIFDFTIGGPTSSTGRYWIVYPDTRDLLTTTFANKLPTFDGTSGPDGPGSGSGVAAFRIITPH